MLGAAPVPGIEEPGRLQMGGGAWYITDSGTPEQQAAAWDFMKFFNSLESQVTWNIDGGYLPYRTTATKDPRVVADWTNTLSGQWLAIAYDELLNGVDPNFPGPLMGPYDQFRAAIRTLDRVHGVQRERVPTRSSPRPPTTPPRRSRTTTPAASDPPDPPENGTALR